MQPQDQSVAPLDGAYGGSGYATNLTSGGPRFKDGAQIGNVPNFRAQAAAGSLSGAELTKLADNQYVLTLSSEASSRYTPDASIPLSTFTLDAQSHLQVNTSFRILSPSGQRDSQPATIHYRLEHFGTLSSINNAYATTKANLDLTASGSSQPFHYGNVLQSPVFSIGFDDTEFIGTRNHVEEGTLTSYTNGLITLSAMLDSQAGPPTRLDPTIRCGGDCRFDSGLRLYMTVTPEPATVLLLIAGACLGVGKRRGFGRRLPG